MGAGEGVAGARRKEGQVGAAWVGTDSVLGFSRNKGPTVEKQTHNEQ